jgi:hypothetical protein
LASKHHRPPPAAKSAVRVDTVNGHPYRQEVRQLARWGLGGRVERVCGTVDGHPAV